MEAILHFFVGTLNVCLSGLGQKLGGNYIVYEHQEERDLGLGPPGVRCPLTV